MIRQIENAKIAIVGGGRFCDKLLRHLLGDHFKDRHPEVLGVADLDDKAVGITYARSLGIYTCGDYREICSLEGLETIIEVTWDLDLARTISRIKPAEVELIDHQDSRFLWDLLQLETIRREALDSLTTETLTLETVQDRIHQCFRKTADILMQRNRRFKQIETELYENEKSLSQIIQGSTIPTFVINRDHVVTHWNHALEVLTGHGADRMVGTRNHWKPFRRQERPIMADVILDQLETGEIDHYYGSKWQPSTLVEGGFEAEEYFDHLGDGGCWLFFTAAPIKASDGTIIGAIETLWDNTENRRAEVERRKYTRRIEESERTLSQIIQGSTIPTFVLNRDHVITHWNQALEKLTGYPAARMVGTRHQWEPFWESERPCMADVLMEQQSEAELSMLYGEHWRKSTLIEDGYEAEVFFPRLGKRGRWCWFTATPLKTSDGTVVGAMETFWDTTENKRAETESRRYVKELEETEQALSQIIQGSTAPTFVINRNHIVTHWNQALEELTGFAANEIVGTNHHWKPFRKKARPIMADVILDQLESGEISQYYGAKWRPSALVEDAYEAEEFFEHLGEKGRWLLFTAAPIKASDGTLMGAIETLWDTTEKKRIEGEHRRDIIRIEESENRLTQIIQGSTIPTFILNGDHVITNWNHALERLSGFSSMKMVGTRHQWVPFWDKERPTMADVILDQRSEQEIWDLYGGKWKKSELIEGAYEAEVFFHKLGKGGKWLFFTAAPIRATDGSVIGAIETFWDTTEKKEAETQRARYTREVEESRRSLSQIIQGSTIPTFVLNQEHVITHWNRALEQLTGYPASQMVGTNNQWVPFWDSERSTMADVILDQKSDQDVWDLYGGKWKKSELIDGAYEAEVFFPKLGNDGKWCWFTAAPIKAADGSVIGAIETLWDNTPKKRADADRRQYTRKLEENQRALSQIIQGSTIPTFVLNRDHTITHWNQAMEKLTGHPSSEMVGTNRQWAPFWSRERPAMADLILDQKSDQEIWDLYGAKWKKSALIDGGYEAEVFFPRLGVSGRWCWFTAAPIKAADGTVVGAIETLWDTTAAKQAEEEQRRRNRELSTLCSIYTALNAPLTLQKRIEGAVLEIRDFMKAESVCLYMAEDGGRFDLRYFNTCYADPGYGQAGPDSQAEIIRKVFRTDKPIIYNEGDHRGRFLNDEETAGPTFAYVPISAKETKGLGVMRIERETERFSSEELNLLDLIGNRIGATIENALLHEELMRKSNFQAKLIKSANDGIIATDDQWKTVIFNPAAERIFGYSAADVVSTKDARAFLPQWVQETLTRTGLGEDANETSPWVENDIRASTGEPIPVRFSGTVLREKKKMMGTVAFFQDLREIKRLERDLVNSERLAAVGQTVAGMAHCIKNILHGFKGGSYLMDVGLERDNTEKLRSGWEMIQRNITRTSDLVMDLLSYSKEREPEYETCNPNDIAGDVCELLDGVARDHEVTMVKQLSDRMTPVIMDPRTVHRCLMNLVTNAIDACIFDPDVEKDHQVTVTTEKEETGTIRFDVSDNGCGMSEEVRSKLFSSFFSTKGVKGTGLGLLVTAKLVEEHKGTIDVASTEGEGTTFSIRFPAQVPDAVSLN
ncbi:PAS domain S-box protein [uncultured Desulfosarcina sp.]|uniref:PAS domain S-box protein n=1 Tax=uncultured Desulfosarcina sp. TaxID=218289 RepID=UPI0029C76091|nr:PAS domain S-box protein [uncultured Desulfosarcina sp.]